MILPIILLLMIFIGIIVPHYKFIQYMYLCVIIITFTTFFIWPDNSFDLYRNYMITDKLASLDIFSFFSAKNSFVNAEEIVSTAAEQYRKSYPIYSFFSWLIGAGKFYQLLPASITFLTYFWGIKRIADNLKNGTSTYIAALLSFFLTLITYNYLFIVSNLRYPFVGAMFAYLTYEEIVLKQHRKLCCFFYCCLPFIHSIGFLFLAFRILLFIYNKYTKVFILLLILFSNYLLLPISRFFLKYTSGVVWVALDKYVRYNEIRSNAGTSHVSLKLSIIYILIFILILFFSKAISRSYGKYTDLIFIYIVFAFSALNQSDLFNRIEFVLLPSVIPVLQKIISIYTCENKYFNWKKNKILIGKSIIASFLIVTVINFVIACNKDYVKLSPYMSMDNFMNNGTLEDSYWNEE